MALSVGARVRVVGLEAHRDLNGRRGSLARYDAGTQRWDVQLYEHARALSSEHTGSGRHDVVRRCHHAVPFGRNLRRTV